MQDDKSARYAFALARIRSALLSRLDMGGYTIESSARPQVRYDVMMAVPMRHALLTPQSQSPELMIGVELRTWLIFVSSAPPRLLTPEKQRRWWLLVLRHVCFIPLLCVCAHTSKRMSRKHDCPL